VTKQLPVLESVRADTGADEILRVWRANNKQHFILRADAWEDPAAWGLLLVDIARQCAQAFVSRTGGDRQTILNRIKSGFDAEWTSGTSSSDTIKSQ
jgi:hypothetical protein